MKRLSVAQAAGILLLLLLVNTAYLAAFASPTIFYMANVLGHVVAGLALAAVALRLLWSKRELRRGALPALLLFAVSLLLGLYLVRWSEALEGWGNTTDNRRIFWAHVATGGLA